MSKNFQRPYAEKEVQSLLAAIVESSDDAVLSMDLDGTILSWNKGAQRLFGYSAEEMTGRSVMALLPGDRREEEESIHRKLRAGERMARIETVRLAKDGSPIHVSVTVSPIKDPDGRIIAASKIIRDITENKQTGQAILRAKQEWERTFDAVPDLMAILDRGYRIARVNRAMADRLDLSPEKCIGLVCHEVVHGLCHPPEVCPHTLTCRDGRQHVAEVYEPRFDGYFLVSTTPLHDVQGKIVGSVHVARDITERKRAEEALRKSESHFRLLSETAGRLLTAEDPQGIVSELCLQVMEHLDCQIFLNFLVNEEVKRLRLNACAGISEEEAGKIEWLDHGAAVWDSVAPECRRIVVEDILHISDPRTDMVKPFGIQAYACHPLMVQGRLIGTLSFGTKTRTGFSSSDLDLMKTVTDQVAIAVERKRLIEELQRSRNELEVRVLERTAEIEKKNEEQKVYTAMLEQSNRDLEDFAYVASHDLQEPLRKIRTFGDLLAETVEDSLKDEARDYLKRMQRAAARMQTLVMDLLRYARVTSKTESFRRFNLKSPIAEAISDLDVLRDELGGRIQVGGLPDVVGDQVQMRQLFQNLIGNGLKYHSRRRPLIKVYCDPASPSPFWEIHVEDNGIGFDETYLQSIFKPFQRLHGRNSPYEGTGMGLAICRKIVERHGGSITAKSDAGKGSTFIVKLPKKQLRIKENR